MICVRILHLSIIECRYKPPITYRRRYNTWNHSSSNEYDTVQVRFIIDNRSIYTKQKSQNGKKEHQPNALSAFYYNTDCSEIVFNFLFLQK